MNSKIIIASLFATLTAGCMSSNQPDHAVDQEGRTWVRLSTADPLLPDVARRAEEAGCKTVDDSVYGNEVELVCQGEKLIVRQNIRWLGFQCSSLQSDACGHMVLAFTTDSRSARMNALGGTPWGF